MRVRINIKKFGSKKIVWVKQGFDGKVRFLNSDVDGEGCLMEAARIAEQNEVFIA